MTVESSLVEEVRACIGKDISDDEFLALCRDIAAAQGRLSDGDGLEAIEPVAEGAYKLMTVACFAPSEAQAEFFTSGTTTGTRGRHLVRDVSLYRKSLVAGFERFVMYPPRPTIFVSLVSSWEERPHSSLSAMASMVAAGCGFSEITFARHGSEIDISAFVYALDRAVRLTQPLVVMGTTLDFLTLFDALEAEKAQRWSLPSGSRIVHTGGSKASGRELTPESLHAGLLHWFAIAPEDAIEEYGMTELLSQAYDSPRVTRGQRRMVPVGWMRTRVVEPATLCDVREGERGLLLHYDLANVYSAVAILTSDLARRVGDGFRDITRLKGAPTRGCSAEAANSWKP